MKSNSIIALLAGTAIGVAIGVLIAPEKGSETRRRLISEGEDLKDSARDKIIGHLKNLEEALTKEEQKAEDA